MFFCPRSIARSREYHLKMSSTDAKDKQVPTKSQSENENSENKLLDPKQVKRGGVIAS